MGKTQENENQKDYLNRQKTVENLMQVLNSLSRRNKNCAFALEGAWGSGKTFLVNLLEQEVRIMQKEQTCEDAFFFVKYDCWKYNYYSEPIVAILITILDELKNEQSWLPIEAKNQERVEAAFTVLKERIKEYGGKIIENKIGFNPLEFYKNAKSDFEEALEDVHKVEKEADTYHSLKEILNDIRKALTEIAERKTVIFVIDELDRCLPEYAVKVLEQVHHIFSQIPNFITILVINKAELENIISLAYGENIETDAYLKKIIDFYFKIDEGEPVSNYLEKYSDYLDRFSWKEEELLWSNEFLTTLLKKENIRKQEKIFAKAELLHDIFFEENSDISCMVFEILYLYCQNIDEMKRYLENVQKRKVSYNIVIYNGKEYEVLLDNLCSKILWYIENMNHNEKKGYCGTYFNIQSQLYHEEIKKLKQMIKMSSVIL